MKMALLPWILAGGLALGFLPLAAQPAPKGEEIADRIMRSACFLVVEHTDKVRNGRISVARGTGSLIVNGRRKIVLTNYHVVGTYDDVCVMFPLRKPNGDLIAEPMTYIENRKNPQYAVLGKVIDRLPEKDLALIELKTQELPSHLRPLPLAEKAPKPASTVHTMGNPAASGMWSYTKGEVRTVYETTRFFPLDGEQLRVTARVVDTSNPLSGGDSGGPLVNDRCELVGVVQSVASQASSLSSNIAIEEVWAFLKKNRLEKEVQRGARDMASAKEEQPKATKPALAASSTKPAPSDDEKKALAERYAAGKLKLARQLAGKERREMLEEIIEKYPGTKAAIEAKELLK